MRRWFPLAAAAGLIGLWAFLAFVPAGKVSTPPCQVRSWTGLHCPGCGGTRAARHLAHGRVGMAARSNVLIFPVVAGLLWLPIALAANAWAGKRWWTPNRISLALAIGLGLVAALFTVVRNLEAGWFLRPGPPPSAE